MESRLRIPVGGEELVARIATPDAGARVDWSFLYVHGFGSSQAGEKASFFRARAAAARLPFVSLDLRGHGESGGALAALTFERVLEDLATVHDRLAAAGRPRVVAVGSSLGGAAVLAHAARRPAGVLACLVIAPAVGMAEALESWAGPERLAAWQEQGSIRFASELVETELSWQMVEDLHRHDFAEIAARFAAPALVLQGRRDAAVDYRDVLAFVARTPPGLVDLVLWGDGDHRLLDRMDLLWARMIEFLARRGLLGADLD